MKLPRRSIRISSMLFLTVILFMLPGASVMADEIVYINPNSSPPAVAVNRDDTVIIRWGWLNCTRGLDLAWKNATVQSYTLKDDTTNDVILEVSSADAKNYWGNPIPVEGGEACFWPATETWAITWYYQLSPLQTGDYTLESHIDISHPLIDGFDLNEDGQPDIYTPGSFIPKTVKLHVY